MLAGLGAIALWGALASLSVAAGPVPPFQMVAMTFAVGAAIGVVRARARGLARRGPASPAARARLLGIGGLFGYHALYFAALGLGFIASSGLSHLLSRRMGLIEPKSGERETPSRS